MEYKCPNCNQEVVIRKEKLVKCNNCGKKVLLVTIGGVKQLFDVTPNKEELKK